MVGALIGSRVASGDGVLPGVEAFSWTFGQAYRKVLPRTQDFNILCMKDSNGAICFILPVRRF